MPSTCFFYYSTRLELGQHDAAGLAIGIAIKWRNDCDDGLHRSTVFLPDRFIFGASVVLQFQWELEHDVLRGFFEVAKFVGLVRVLYQERIPGVFQ
jgi:hypothetical protein